MSDFMSDRDRNNAIVNIRSVAREARNRAMAMRAARRELAIDKAHSDGAVQSRTSEAR